jgi:hypothetical protein
VLIFAGMSPIAQEGELPGSRNEFIYWLRDVNDRRAIVRQYMRYDNEIRTGVNVKQPVYRAMQFAKAIPRVRFISPPPARSSLDVSSAMSRKCRRRKCRR